MGSSFERLQQKYKNRELAGDYRRRFTVGARRRSTWFILRALRRALGLGSKTILDVPTGTGRFAFPLDRAGHRVVGGDFSAEMLHEAHSRRDGAGPVFFRGDVRRLPFGDRSFDVALCVRLFHLLQPEERILVMKELRRVAREKIVVVYYPRHTVKQLGRWLRWRLGIIPRPRTRYLPLSRIREEVAAAGLRLVAIRFPFRWLIDDWVVEAR